MSQALVVTEKDFLENVLELARLNGWKVAHFRPARTTTGWRTAVQADGAGFPDLVLVRGGRLVFAELKRDNGRLTTAQQAWIASLDRTCADVYVWRPSDFDEIARVLAR